MLLLQPVTTCLESEKLALLFMFICFEKRRMFFSQARAHLQVSIEFRKAYAKP